MSGYEGDDPFAGHGPVGEKKTRRAAAVLEAPAEEDGDLDRSLAFEPLNDFGNANRLVQRFGDDLLHTPNIGWFTWDDTRWNLKRGAMEAVKFGHRVAQLVRHEAKALQAKPTDDLKASEERVGKLHGWAVLTGNQAKVSSMLSAAQPYLAADVEELDSDPFLAACQNGTVMLSQNCRLRDSLRKDRITRALGANYDVNATCPLFEKFLEEILPDEPMRRFVQRIFGYALTGSVREQKFFIFWGGGLNGKSTLINVMREVIGDYGMMSPIQTFLAKKDGNSGAEASPDVARPPGARLVTASEPPEGARLDEARIKEITGNEPMTARHLNRDFFEFRPCCKVIILTNHQPTIRGADHGIWRRVLLVPFTVTVAKVDRELETKLLRERDGILQWALAGCEAWLERGLDPPEKAIAATELYRADQDPVGEFLKANYELTKDAIRPSTGRMYEVDVKELRADYKNWCEDQGLDPLPAKTFGSKLRAHGIDKRSSNGKTLYIGLHPRGLSAE